MSKANPRFRRVNPTLFPPFHGTYRVRITGTIESQLTVSTFYYRDADGPLSESLIKMQALATGILSGGSLMSFYGQACSSDWDATEVLVDSPVLQVLATVVEYAGAFAGGGPAGHEPTTVAAIIHRQTGTKGQCGRGHVSLPAVPTAWVTASKITTPLAYTSFAAAMVTPVTSGGTTFTPCLYSKGTRIQKTVGVADLTSATPRDLLGTVRRRLLGRGK